CMTSRIVAIAWPEPTPGGVGGESRAGVRSRRGREAGPSGVVLAAARRLPVANRPARSLPGPGERGDAPADAGRTGGAGVSRVRPAIPDGAGAGRGVPGGGAEGVG